MLSMSPSWPTAIHSGYVDTIGYSNLIVILNPRYFPNALLDSHFVGSGCDAICWAACAAWREKISGACAPPKLCVTIHTIYKPSDPEGWNGVLRQAQDLSRGLEN